MKILLVNPAGLDVFARVGGQLPPLGLGYIAAVVKQHGQHVEIDDLEISHRRISHML
jgi:hypothetical protein